MALQRTGLALLAPAGELAPTADECVLRAS